MTVRYNYLEMIIILIVIRGYENRKYTKDLV